ncbi:unnamed protein product [Sphagnum balticum]
MLPCSACAKSGKSESCKVLANKSKRCRECVRRGLPRCDVSGVPAGNLSRLIKEDERLQTEREAALAEALEALARAERLKKQSLAV